MACCSVSSLKGLVLTGVEGTGVESSGVESTGVEGTGVESNGVESTGLEVGVVAGNRPDCKGVVNDDKMGGGKCGAGNICGHGGDVPSDVCNTTEDESFDPSVSVDSAGGVDDDCEDDVSSFGVRFSSTMQFSTLVSG